VNKEIKKKIIRPPQKCFRASVSDMKLIENNFRKSGIGCFTTYARRMLIDGKVNVVSHFEVEAIKGVKTELSRIGNNVNQIARIANSTSKIFKAEVAEMLENQREIETLLVSILNEHRNLRID
jgi:hypothetical protein